MRKILMLAVTLSAVIPAMADTVAADLLVYRVSEVGTEPYFSRVLVTPRHVRMDEGSDDAGYTLFDRTERVFYNVDPADQTVLVIDPPLSRSQPPMPLELTEEPSPVVPPASLDGVALKGYHLLANGVLCSELQAAPGLLSAAVDALAEFYDRLSYQHAVAIPGMPADLLEACDLAQNVFAPRRSYGFGLPVTERSARVDRQLVDHGAAVPASDGLFEVPPDYRRVPMPGVSARE
jgi:hypothetical protein